MAARARVNTERNARPANVTRAERVLPISAVSPERIAWVGPRKSRLESKRGHVRDLAGTHERNLSDLVHHVYGYL